MLKYRLIITIGNYYSMNLVFDKLDELGSFVESVVNHHEDGEDRVSYKIEIICPANDEEEKED